MRLHNFIDALYEAGWRSSCDAQHSEIKELYAKLFPALAELEEELESAQSYIKALEQKEPT